MITKKSVSIIGFGRMGKVLAELLKPDFTIHIYDPQIKNSDLDLALAQSTIFVAVPIRNFSTVIQHIAPQINPGTTIIDVCSVKTFPVEIMQRYLPSHSDIIATHPLFGPDSIHSSSLKMTFYPVRDQFHHYAFWKDYFQNKKIQTLELSPEEHDQLAAQSQVITHVIGRTLKEAKITSTAVDTLGFQKLLDVMEQTTHDSWELFRDLIHYNPYASAMIKQLKSALENTEKKVNDEQTV